MHERHFGLGLGVMPTEEVEADAIFVPRRPLEMGGGDPDADEQREHNTNLVWLIAAVALAAIAVVGLVWRIAALFA